MLETSSPEHLEVLGELRNQVKISRDLTTLAKIVDQDFEFDSSQPHPGPGQMTRALRHSINVGAYHQRHLGTQI